MAITCHFGRRKGLCHGEQQTDVLWPEVHERAPLQGPCSAMASWLLLDAAVVDEVGMNAL